MYSQNNEIFEGYSLSIEQAIENAIYELELAQGDTFFIAERVEANLLENMPNFEEILVIIKKNTTLRYKNFNSDSVVTPNQSAIKVVMKSFANSLATYGFDLNYFKVKNKVEYKVLSNDNARAASLKEDITLDVFESDIIKRALGGAHKRGVTANRKYFATKINSDEFNICTRLVEKGYMTVGSKNKTTIFHVTLKGAEKVGMSRVKFKEIPQ